MKTKTTFPTRAKYLREIAKATEAYQIADYMNHPSKRVQRAVSRLIAHLERVQTKVPEKTELEVLIERFTREGKPNPEKSARASLARKAQLKAKVA